MFLDSLENEIATHSSTLALKIPWTEELGAGYYPWGHKESGTTERLHFTFLLGMVLSDNATKHGCGFFIFFFGYSGFLLFCGLSLIAASGGYSLSRCTGFLLQWLLLWSSV